MCVCVCVCVVCEREGGEREGERERDRVSLLGKSVSSSKFGWGETKTVSLESNFGYRAGRGVRERDLGRKISLF